MTDVVWRAAVAGLVGGMAMMVIGQLPRLAGLPAVDLGRIAEAKLLRYHHERTSPISVGLHFSIALAFALLYGALLQPLLPGPQPLDGLLYGAAIWTVVMLAVLPAMGEGLLGRRIGVEVAPISLLMHLAYGTVLGAAFAL